MDSEFQKSMKQRAIAKYSHEKRSIDAKKSNIKRVSEGTHNFLGAGEKIKQEILNKKNRDSVMQLRKISKMLKIKLGMNWYRKPDEWIERTLIELTT